MSSLSGVLASAQQLADAGETWQPLRFRAADPATAVALDDLLDAGEVARICDSLPEQLMELMEIRAPELDLDRGELQRRASNHLGGRPIDAYGTWVYYPWSKRLVHLLPEAEYTEVRRSRNRNKITIAEQERLACLRIGIIGLSVGQATAVTLAMEGVGGELRLADFDYLAPSNINRLRTGVHNIGLNKAVLAAREIFEIDPYANVTIFRRGINNRNIDEFLVGGGPLDLLVEECDDLYMKIRIREQARAARIAVVMETSDRGLIDIERFDLEPDRPILHGLVGDLDARALYGLDTYDKVPIVLRILGQQNVSPRLAASLVEIKSTLKSWPQLASAVALGGAVSTDVIRRIGLGQLQTSGRFYVDLDRLVRHDAAANVDLDADVLVPVPESRVVPAAPTVRAPPSEHLDAEAVRALVTLGAMAPSGGNCQPWRFEFDGERLRCIHDVARSASFLDYEHLATYLAFGAVVENISLAAEQMGLDLRVALFPDAADASAICDLRFARSAALPAPSDLFAQISLRVTNRQLGPRAPFEPEVGVALAQAASLRGAQLQVVHDDDSLTALGEILGRGDRVRFLSEVMHREMMAELRWGSASVAASRDGMDVATLELTPTDLAGLRITSAWPVMALVGRVGGGRSLEKMSKKSVAAASAMGLVTVPGAMPEDFFRGGRALQRVWLTATAQGYALQPMTAITYLFARLELGDGVGLSAAERAELSELRCAYRRFFSLAPGHGEALLFRLARAEPATARSLRRNVEDILTFVPAVQGERP